MTSKEQYDFSKPDDFISQEISEKQAIELILSAFEGNKHYSDLNIFNNILYGVEYLQNWRQFTGCYCLTNFLTKDIGLLNGVKPGEIDILLIPYNEKEIFYQKSSAFEVKILKPSSTNLRKGPNTDGYSQTLGLIKLGFPYVGLIHIVVPSPLPENEKHEITFFKRPGNIEKNSGESIPRVDDTELIKWDWLPFYSELNQKKRLLSYDFPKYVGLKTLSLNFYKNGGFAIGNTADMKDFETGYLNPHKRKETVDLIKLHHKNNLTEYKNIRLNLP